MLYKIVVGLLFVTSWGYGQILTLKEETFSFGDISNIRTVSRDVEFQNTGDKPLIIEKVRASCGCTASSLEKKKLDPSESSKLTVTFNPKGRSGQQSKNITFYSNDIENKVKRISFTANVVPVWDVEPRRLEFKLKADRSDYEVTEQNLIIKNLGEEPIQVESISSANSNLTIETPENMEIKPDEKMETTVKINPDYKPDYSTPTSILISGKIGGESTNRNIRVIIAIPPTSGTPDTYGP